MTHHEAGHLQGREVVIVAAARTPIGRGHRAKGWFREVHPNELLDGAYRSVIERAGIDAGLVQNVGMCTAGGAGTGTILQRV